MDKNTKESTLSQEASRVSLTPSQVKDLLREIHAIYGRKCIGSFARLNPDGSWLKTSQGFSQVSLGGTSEEFCETWPKRGIACNGFAFQLQRLEPSTNGRESGLLRTPCASDGTGGPKSKETMKRKMEQGMPINLRDQVAHPELFPTPTASDYKRNGSPADYKRNSPSLGAIANQGNQKPGQLNPEWVEWLMGFPIGHTELKD